jgi:hypothetical protein
MARRADDYAWHAAKIRKGLQQLLADGAVLEDVWNMTPDAARTEWECTRLYAAAIDAPDRRP